ncbi:MAG: tRNA modification GTPase [Planctomycetota bacterium]
MTAWDTDDTIAAIASAHSGGLRGIVRISGPETAEICDRVFDIADGSLLAGIKKVTSIDCSLDIDGIPLRGHLLFWPTKRSYTRQPTIEFHTAGSLPLLELTLEALCENGARLAEPGEFTLRAFLSGRIDLTQAEAVLGVIDSSGQKQLNDALRQLAGGLSRPLDAIRTSLIHILAELEAGLDFVEEDIEFISQSDLLTGLEKAREQLSSLVEQINTRDAGNHVPRVVLAGLPNAGKSSLYNSLTASGKAIVSNVAGTTRDYVTSRVSCDGVEFELIDTAGLDEVSEQENSIDHQAQAFSTEMLTTANVLVYCHVAGCGKREMPEVPPSVRIVEVTTKSDLFDEPVAPRSPGIITSNVTGKGIEELGLAIADAVRDSRLSGTGIVATTAVRAADALREALNSVEFAGQAAESGAGLELVAAEIRQSLDSLGRVVGTIYTDDILDRIFSRFCIGK